MLNLYVIIINRVCNSIACKVKAVSTLHPRLVATRQCRSMTFVRVLLLLLLFFCASSSSFVAASDQDEVLHIGGIFPINGEGGWQGGQACMPAAYLALEDVNKRADLLPGFQLRLHSNDSEVSIIAQIQRKICMCVYNQMAVIAFG